jgi:hypothetical protein
MEVRPELHALRLFSNNTFIDFRAGFELIVVGPLFFSVQYSLFNLQNLCPRR